MSGNSSAICQCQRHLLARKSIIRMTLKIQYCIKLKAFNIILFIIKLYIINKIIYLKVNSFNILSLLINNMHSITLVQTHLKTESFTFVSDHSLSQYVFWTCKRKVYDDFISFILVFPLK